nr:MAG TPA: hypothetical protein [Caudoviricetes sp.]
MTILYSFNRVMSIPFLKFFLFFCDVLSQIAHGRFY